MVINHTSRSNHSRWRYYDLYAGSFIVAGPSWMQDGIYTVNINQGPTSVATAKIEVTNGEIIRLFDFEGSYKDTEKMDHDMEHQTKDTMMEEQGLSIVDASQEGATMIMVTGSTDKSDQITVLLHRLHFYHNFVSILYARSLLCTNGV